MKTNYDIITILNKIPYSISINKNSSISQILEIIFNSLKLNPKFYEISYENNILELNDNRLLSAIIGNKKTLFFQLNKKKIKVLSGKKLPFLNNLSYSSNNDSMSFCSNLNDKLKKSSPNEIKKKNSYCQNLNQVKIGLNKNKNSLIKNYSQVTKSNQNFGKIKFKKLNLFSNNSKSTSRIFGGKKKMILNKLNDNNYNISLTPRHYINNFSLGEFDPYINKENSEIINNFYSNQKFVRNSSPYITEEEKRIIEEKINKKKCLTKNGFLTCVGKYKMKPNFIKNYVQMTPSESPLMFKFRVENKNKWLTKKGFIIA